jgi:ParB-like nuclease domain
MIEKIELRSAPHRKIAVADILPNPHRDLKLNPVQDERVDELIESFERSGFWDNIIVREHPTREGKYQLAYGHNRLAALKHKRVVVDTITIPVVKLTDWEMYCTMVDENELSGKVTPQIALENVGVGCDLIERGLNAVGPEGTWNQFVEAIGRHDLVVSIDTTKTWGDHAFEQIRASYFAGEGLGRRFLIDFLPCGKMRSNAISTIVQARYGEAKAKAKEEQAKAKEKEAKEEREREAAEQDEKRKAEAKARATAAETEAKKLRAEAKKIGKGAVSVDVLLMFETPNAMTEFAEAIRRLEIPKNHHVAAAKHIIAEEVHGKKLERTLDLWWDVASGAEAARKKQAKTEQEREKFKKAARGTDAVDYLLKIADDLKDIEPRIKIVLQYVHLFGPRERKVIRDRIAAFSDLLDALLERERETLSEIKNVTPAKTMLSHQKG